MTAPHEAHTHAHSDDHTHAHDHGHVAAPVRRIRRVPASLLRLGLALRLGIAAGVIALIWLLILGVLS